MTFYIVSLAVIFFTKELIVINPEFIVIIGFLTIFFILKSLTQDVLVESFDSYADQIRKTYLSALFAAQNTANINIKQTENNTQVFDAVSLFYEYVLGLTVLFFDKIRLANNVLAIENATGNMKRIFINIGQMKKSALSKSLINKRKHK